MGAMIAPGTEISLVVSSGPEVKPTIVPSLLGRTQEQAVSDLHTSNLEVGRVDPVYDDTAPEGTVVYQYPAATTEVPEGSTVNLQISKGPDPDKQPQEVEKTINITLPASENIITIQALMDGKVVYSGTADPTMELVADIPLKGKAGETKQVDIYFDGELVASEQVSF